MWGAVTLFNPDEGMADYVVTVVVQALAGIEHDAVAAPAYLPLRATGNTRHLTSMLLFLNKYKLHFRSIARYVAAFWIMTHVLPAGG